MRFDGSSGRRPVTEARRYIYNVLATAIGTDLEDLEGWLLGGIDEESDRRRIRKAAKAVVAELRRKGSA